MVHICVLFGDRRPVHSAGATRLGLRLVFAIHSTYVVFTHLKKIALRGLESAKRPDVCFA